ncbi:MAG: CRISPR-associated endonuclease Cas2 [Tissierellaceae bacterium]
MRVICMFDLPVVTDNEKRAYREFRKFLLKNGFEMLQFSIYIRTCPNRSFAKKFYKKIEINSPRKGDIRLLTITEKQFEDMEWIICDHKEKRELIKFDDTVVI